MEAKKKSKIIKNEPVERVWLTSCISIVFICCWLDGCDDDASLLALYLLSVRFRSIVLRHFFSRSVAFVPQMHEKNQKGNGKLTIGQTNQPKSQEQRNERYLEERQNQNYLCIFGIFFKIIQQQHQQVEVGTLKTFLWPFFCSIWGNLKEVLLERKPQKSHN